MLQLLFKEQDISWQIQLNLLQMCLKHIFSISRN